MRDRRLSSRKTARAAGAAGAIRTTRARATHAAGASRALCATRALAAVGCIAVLGLVLFAGSPAAWAALPTPNLATNSSTNTMVGLQVWDHTNLSGGASPTGTIDFKLYEPGDTTCATPVFTSTVPVSGTGSDDSARWTTTGAGTYNWTAAYSGDANNNPVATPCGAPTQVVFVGKQSPVGSTTAAFSGGTLHATTTLSGGFAPLGGTLTFYLTGPGDQFCQGTPLATTTVPVNGAGTYDSGPYTPTVAGSYAYRVGYSGDDDNGGLMLSCIAQGASITVTQAELAPMAAPDAVSLAASSVASTTAQLNGRVNPQNQSTAYAFEYGTSTSFGSMTPSAPLSAGNTAITVSGPLSGLAMHTNYYYRVIATNATGSTFGAVKMFTTGPNSAPVVLTGAVSGVSQTSATLWGTINPGGEMTRFTFEYGPTTTFGSITYIDTMMPTSGSHTVSLPVTGLARGTTYLYRLVATNASGTTSASVGVLTTAP